MTNRTDRIIFRATVAAAAVAFAAAPAPAPDESGLHYVLDGGGTALEFFAAVAAVVGAVLLLARALERARSHDGWAD